MELIHRADVFEKAFPDILLRERGAVEIDILTRAVIGTHTDEITFIADDVNQLILAIESPQGGIGLPLLLACLDGDGDGRCILEWKLRIG